MSVTTENSITVSIFQLYLCIGGYWVLIFISFNRLITGGAFTDKVSSLLLSEIIKYIYHVPNVNMFERKLQVIFK